MVRPVSFLALAVCLMYACVSSSAAAPTWPTNPEDWTPVKVGGALYVDPLYTGLGSDYYATPPEPEQTDLVGGVDHHGNGPFATGFWATDGDNLMFRMRVDNDPYQGAGVLLHVWTVFLNTDDDDEVDWAMQLDENFDDQVEFVQAVEGGPTTANPWNPVTLAGTPHTGVPSATWSRILDASTLPLDAPYGGSHFHDTGPDDDDFFVDIAMPIATIESVMAAAGETWTGKFSSAFATSADHVNINKDLPETGWSNIVPEPATVGMLMLGGLALLRPRRRA